MSEDSEEVRPKDDSSQTQENPEKLEPKDDFENLSDKERRILADELAKLDPDFENLSDKERKSLANELDKSRENTRSWLAKVLMAILFLTVASSVTLSSVIIFLPPNESVEQRKENYAYSKDILALLLSTQTTLIGTVLGFYFGSMQKNS